MNGKIDKNGNLHIERGKLGYVPCECINSNYVQTGYGDGASYVQGWQDGIKSCGHRCSHFEEPTLEKDSEFINGKWVYGDKTYTELILCHGKTLTFDKFTDERGDNNA